MILLFFLATISGVVLYPQLPSKLPTHWNIYGQIDSYMPKNIAIWLIPGLILLMIVGFQIMPALDPKKEKYKLFRQEWEIIQLIFVGFFSYLHGIILYLSLNPTKNIRPLMFIGFGTLFILLGNYLSKVRQNYFLGIKTPWALSDEDNWNKTHRFASWCFVIAGVIILFEAYFIWLAPVVVFASIFSAAIIPTVYSYLIFKNKKLS